MKRIFKTVCEFGSTIKFFIEPIVKHGGLMLLISSAILSMTLIPINSFLSINIHQVIIDNINTGSSLWYIVLIIVIYHIMDLITAASGPFFFSNICGKENR